MNAKEIAHVLVEANRANSADAIGALLNEHYAPNAVSVEAVAMDPARGREVQGIDAIKAKHAWWDSMMETKNVTASEPMMHGEDRFAVIFGLTAKNRQTGEETTMQEVAVYTVNDGKIVREEFYYTA